MLHDIGHCFYSHLSEAFYGALPEFVQLLKYFNITYGVKPKPHEILSYFIVNTDSFKKFPDSNHVLDSAYVSASDNLDNLMRRIGNMIIGISNLGRKTEGKDHKKYSFLTKIINGDIDADKLDYIKRDSYCSGVPLTFDIERLLYKMTIREPRGTNEYQLVVDIAGIAAVEEIAFSKLMLNNYIYHHQKVLATEVMAKDIALALMELRVISHPVDFLNYTDKSIEAMIDDPRIPFSDCTQNLGFFVKKVKHRYLPKRCFEINSRILEPDYSEEERIKQEQEYIKKCLDELEQAADEKEKSETLINFASDLFELTNTYKNHVAQFTKFMQAFAGKTYKEYTQWIRKDIYNKICWLYQELQVKIPVGGISLFDVHVVVPKSIDEQTLYSTPIVYRNAEALTPTNMMSFTKNWAQAFNTNKWSGYVFVSPHINVTIAFQAALAVFKEHIRDVKFTNPDYYVKRLDDTLMAKVNRLNSLKQ